MCSSSLCMLVTVLTFGLTEWRRRTNALWSGTNENRDVSTGPLARPFARSLALLIRSLAPDCTLWSRPPMHSLVHSLAHSLAYGTVNNWMAILSLFFSNFDHSALLSGAAKRICVHLNFRSSSSFQIFHNHNEFFELLSAEYLSLHPRKWITIRLAPFALPTRM